MLCWSHFADDAPLGLVQSTRLKLISVLNYEYMYNEGFQLSVREDGGVEI